MLYGCNTNNSTVKDQTLYQLVSRQDTSSFTYTPGLSTNKEDFIFSEYLLSSLDTALSTLQFTVCITGETVVKTDSDTTANIVVYDFVGNQDKIKPIFKDKMFIDAFVGIYEAPVFCRFILTENTLCAICCSGIEIDTAIDNKLFLEFIAKDTQQRLKYQQLGK